MYKIIYSPNYSLYNLGKNHPFSPLRAKMVFDFIQETIGEINLISPEKPVSPEELEGVHSAEYIKAVELASKGEVLKDIEKFGLNTADNPVVKKMGEGARWMCAGTLLGAKLIAEGKTKRALNLGGGLHHAKRETASGFCVYNDIALALKYLTNKGFHTLYLDIDAHHGDGVQQAFYNNDKVMTISIHESGEYLFPGSGWLYEIGSGMGRATSINLPIEPFTEGENYLNLLEKILTPSIQWYRPQIIFVQAGADAHFSDPLADLMLTTRDFEKIFRKILNFADKYTEGRVIFTLGGGYNLFASARIWSILSLLISETEIPKYIHEIVLKKWEEYLNKSLSNKLHDTENPFEPIPRKKEIEDTNNDRLQILLDSLSRYWWY